MASSCFKPNPLSRHFASPACIRSQIRPQFRPTPRCPARPIRSTSTALRLGLSQQTRKTANLLASRPTFRLPLNQSSILNPHSSPWRVTLLALLAIGAIATTLPTRPELNDAATSPLPGSISTSKGVKGLTTDNDSQPIEQIPTDNASVPYFPRKIYLPSTPSNTTTSNSSPAASTSEEYILLGLGLRTVSFLRIKVYIMGLYIAKSDLAALQSAMIHSVATSASASTLVENEKLDLRTRLLSADDSEKIWGHVLGVQHTDSKARIRSAIRVVPVRVTNMGHMRDGFVRMVNAGGKREGVERESGFNEAVTGLKAILGGAASMGSGKVLLLGRSGEGELSVWAERAEGGKVEGGEEADGTSEMLYLGGIQDERIGRALWMGYLAGAKVASEAARESIANGVLDLVERTVGTVETMVI